MHLPRPILRRPHAAVGVLATVLLIGSLTACSGDVAMGEAYPDWDQVEALNIARFDAQMALLDERIARSDPFKTDASMNIIGVRYSLLTYGEEEFGNNNTVVLHGNPASQFTQMVDPGTGTTADSLHIGGTEWDYLLLGSGYHNSTPTPWVRFPTLSEAVNAGGSTTDLCDVLGVKTMCDLRTAMNQTAETATGLIRKSAKVADDGSVFIQTEVTLQSTIDSELYVLPEDATAILTDSMRSALLPVNIWQNTEGDLTKVEINGIVAGVDDDPDLQVQLGFEITGVSTIDDIPAVPADNLVTTLTLDELGTFLENIKATS